MEQVGRVFGNLKSMTGEMRVSLNCNSSAGFLYTKATAAQTRRSKKILNRELKLPSFGFVCGIYIFSIYLFIKLL